MSNKEIRNKNIDINFFKDFDKVEKLLSFKLLGIKGNEEYLENLPYRQIEDLAMVPVCIVRNETIGEGLITINNSHLELWGIDYDKLWKNLIDTASNVTPVKTFGMADFLGEYIINDSEELNRFVVVTNKGQNYGAGAVLYPGVLKKIAKECRKNLYILPASVHEVIVLPESGEYDEAQKLKAIVREVNGGVLSREEFLSDNIYFYDKKAEKISICD